MERSVELDNHSTYEFAVAIKNLCKGYDKKGPRVLNNFSMNVAKGSIYSLLGSSGCGKTTALSCILGVSKWESGEIKVFGENHGSFLEENFFKRIGYVPQEVALYEQITIKENIRYYGGLYGMTKNAVFEQWNLLKKLLMLPAGSKLVESLSGGQKRRVSLVLSLVHQPELLILDEPTVGLDPLLRERVWDYLFNLARNMGTSIIITTHYIEETKKSDIIGVMRNGSLLVEDSPAKLLVKYNTEFLENIILALIKNSSSSPSTSSSGSSDIQNNVTDESHLPNTQNGALSFNSNWKFDFKSAIDGNSTFRSQGTYNNGTFDSNDVQPMNTSKITFKQRDIKDTVNICKHTFSFLRKTLASSILIWLTHIRNPIFFMCTIILPAYQVLLTFGVMGRDPKGLSITVVNEEIPDWQTKCFVNKPPKQILDIPADYKFTDFSCWYLQHLVTDDIIKMVPCNNTMEATNEVHKGNIWGYIHFPANFSQHTVDRFTAKQFATEESINGSTIGVRLDMSAYVGSSMIIKHLYEQLQDYGNHLVNYFNGSTSTVQLPLVFKKPVYGSISNGYYDHYLPAILAIVFFFIPLSTTGLQFTSEVKTGTFRRAQVAGRTIGEIITAHVVSQFLIIVAQFVICTLCMGLVYNYRVLGSLILYAFVALVIGICGTAVGILIALLIPDECESITVTLFLVYTAFTFGGVFWPCTQPLWRHIGYALPITMIIESLRSVIARGTGITRDLVWPGVAYALGWIVVIWILVVTCSKRLIK